MLTCLDAGFKPSQLREAVFFAIPASQTGFTANAMNCLAPETTRRTNGRDDWEHKQGHGKLVKLSRHHNPAGKWPGCLWKETWSTFTEFVHAKSNNSSLPRMH